MSLSFSLDQWVAHIVLILPLVGSTEKFRKKDMGEERRIRNANAVFPSVYSWSRVVALVFWLT